MSKGEAAEGLPIVVVERLGDDVQAALRRRHAGEAKLAGALRVLIPLSESLADRGVDAAATLAKRGSFARELYASIARALADMHHARLTPILETALASEDAGGLSTLAAAARCQQASLAIPLAKMAATRQSDLAFAAEVARVMRGESNGAYLAALAPKIKESHRIALCGEVLLPLTRYGALPAALAGPVKVLRDTERHLGRWLVLGQIGLSSGDPSALTEAATHAATGAESSRAAWSLVRWALERQAPPPPTRPNIELISRLSDRPSSDRDTAFLFRLAQAGSKGTRVMLEHMAKSTPLATDVAVRAAMHLVRDHGKSALAPELRRVVESKRDEARGVAIAALWDVGEHEFARHAANDAVRSRTIETVGWGALVLRASQCATATPVLIDPTFRRLQRGWLE